MTWWLVIEFFRKSYLHLDDRIPIHSWKEWLTYPLTDKWSRSYLKRIIVHGAGIKSFPTNDIGFGLVISHRVRMMLILNWRTLVTVGIFSRVLLIVVEANHSNFGRWRTRCQFFIFPFNWSMMMSSGRWAACSQCRGGLFWRSRDNLDFDLRRRSALFRAG